MNKENKLLNYTEKAWEMSDGERYGSTEELENFLLHKRVVKWDENTLVLEDGTVVEIGMSESDCCAYASGKFKDVKLDAVITDINISDVEPVDDDDEYGYGDVENKSTVTLFHNQNVVAQADMKAGHNGYYYSVGSLIIKDIHFPVVDA